MTRKRGCTRSDKRLKAEDERGTTMETDVRSLLGAFSEILNLINPAMEYHHEQTAYPLLHNKL